MNLNYSIKLLNHCLKNISLSQYILQYIKKKLSLINESSLNINVPSEMLSTLKHCSKTIWLDNGSLKARKVEEDILGEVTFETEKKGQDFQSNILHPKLHAC